MSTTKKAAKKQSEWLAMILAGGKGARLGALTDYAAKPAIPFGGSNRIIDFTLNNCACSGIDTVGVLTQYRASELHNYIGNNRAWTWDKTDGVRDWNCRSRPKARSPAAWVRWKAMFSLFSETV